MLKNEGEVSAGLRVAGVDVHRLLELGGRLLDAAIPHQGDAEVIAQVRVVGVRLERPGVFGGGFRCPAALQEEVSNRHERLLPKGNGRERHG